MQKTFLLLNNVQTQVIIEGQWVEESFQDDKKNVVIVIPGNPGVPQFYEGFIKSLSNRLPFGTPICVIGHAGHVEPSKDLKINVPSDKEWHKYYGLSAQVEHKVNYVIPFFNFYLTNNYKWIKRYALFYCVDTIHKELYSK